jgi:hypothetical protein
MMKQSRCGSFVESAVNIVVGLAIAPAQGPH